MIIRTHNTEKRINGAIFDINNMSFQEIKLLVRTACYLER